MLGRGSGLARRWLRKFYDRVAPPGAVTPAELSPSNARSFILCPPRFLSLVARHLVSAVKTRSEVNYLLELEEVAAGRSGGGKGGRKTRQQVVFTFWKVLLSALEESPGPAPRWCHGVVGFHRG